MHPEVKQIHLDLHLSSLAELINLLRFGHSHNGDVILNSSHSLLHWNFSKKREKKGQTEFRNAAVFEAEVMVTGSFTEKTSRGFYFNGRRSQFEVPWHHVYTAIHRQLQKKVSSHAV